MNTNIKAALMSALLVGTGGVGAVAMQAHAQDGQNTVTAAVDTTATVLAKPSIHGITVDDDQDVNGQDTQDKEKGSEGSDVSDDSGFVGTDASVGVTIGHDQNEQGDKGGQDSEIDD